LIIYFNKEFCEAFAKEIADFDEIEKSNDELRAILFELEEQFDELKKKQKQSIQELEMEAQRRLEELEKRSAILRKEREEKITSELLIPLREMETKMVTVRERQQEVEDNLAKSREVQMAALQEKLKEKEEFLKNPPDRGN
jgi:hypothetical protein